MYFPMQHSIIKTIAVFILKLKFGDKTSCLFFLVKRKVQSMQPIRIYRRDQKSNQSPMLAIRQVLELRHLQLQKTPNYWY